MDIARSRLVLPSLTALLIAASSLTALATADAAIGPTPDQIEEADDRVDRLEEEISDAERGLSGIRSELADLDAQLERASEVTAAADRRATEAQRAAEVAEADADRTRTELATARTELAANRRTLDDVVRDAYMHGGRTTSPALAAAEQLSSGGDPSDVADVLHYVEVVVGDRGQAVEETERLIQRTNQLLRETRAAEQLAAEEATAATEALEEAATRNAEVLALVDRADSAARDQERMLTELRDERGSAAARLQNLQDARRAAAEAADAAVTITDLGNGLVRVGGITVAAELGAPLEDLLEAARADGIVLGGYGYRSPESTARLRRANGCPDVYDSPASSCRVPTARPGESMHEQGLAIDFTYQGQTLCYPRRASRCTGNAAFDWLTANAGRYGLRVLDSEAWHWSTNGR